MSADTDQKVREIIGWRPEVVAFATLMEQQLRANDHKGRAGWKHDAAGALFDHVVEEVRELQQALTAWPCDTQAYRTNIGKEAADLANMAMMVADVCGSLTGAELARAQRV